MKRIYQTQDGHLQIFAKDEPPQGAFATMALTQPFAVVRVPKTDVKLVKKEFDVLWMKKPKKKKDAKK